MDLNRNFISIENKNKLINDNPITKEYEEFAFEMVNNYPESIEFVNQLAPNYELLASLAVKRGEELKKINLEHINNYYDFLSNIIEDRPFIIETVDETLLTNEEYEKLARKAVEKATSSIKGINAEKISNYDELASLALQNAGFNIEYIDKNKIKEYDKIALEALKYGAPIEKIDSSKIKNYLDFAVETIKIDPFNIGKLDDSRLTDKQYELLIISAIEKEAEIIKMINSSRNIDYTKIVKNAVERDGLTLQYADIDKIGNNYNSIVAAAIKRNPLALKFVDPNKVEDYSQIALEAVKENPKSYEFIDKNQVNNLEIIIKEVKKRELQTKINETLKNLGTTISHFGIYAKDKIKNIDIKNIDIKAGLLSISKDLKAKIKDLRKKQEEVVPEIDPDERFKPEGQIIEMILPSKYGYDNEIHKLFITDIYVNNGINVLATVKDINNIKTREELDEKEPMYYMRKAIGKITENPQFEYVLLSSEEAKKIMEDSHTIQVKGIKNKNKYEIIKENISNEKNPQKHSQLLKIMQECEIYNSIRYLMREESKTHPIVPSFNQISLKEQVKKENNEKKYELKNFNIIKATQIKTSSDNIKNISDEYLIEGINSEGKKELKYLVYYPDESKWIYLQKSAFELSLININNVLNKSKNVTEQLVTELNGKNIENIKEINKRLNYRENNEKQEHLNKSSIFSHKKEIELLVTYDNHYLVSKKDATTIGLNENKDKDYIELEPYQISELRKNYIVKTITSEKRLSEILEKEKQSTNENIEEKQPTNENIEENHPTDITTNETIEEKQTTPLEEHTTHTIKLPTQIDENQNQKIEELEKTIQKIENDISFYTQEQSKNDEDLYKEIEKINSQIEKMSEYLEKISKAYLLMLKSSKEMLNQQVQENGRKI